MTTAPPSVVPELVADETERTILEAFGGRRGLLDGGLPPLVFVSVNAVVGAHAARPEALTAAIAASSAVGVAAVVARLVRRESLRQALAGLAGLALAVAFALRSGEARGFFLPGIYVDAAYGLVFAGSAVLGRPLVGTLWRLLHRRRGVRRTDAHLQRRFTVATLGWAVVFATRATVQALFYLDDRPGLLAAAKLLLGWPLTAAALALTLGYLGRGSRVSR